MVIVFLQNGKKSEHGFAAFVTFIAKTVMKSLPPEYASRLSGYAAYEVQKKEENAPAGQQPAQKK